MAGHREETDPKLRDITGSSALRSEQMQVQRRVDEANKHQPHDGDNDQGLPKRHGQGEVFNFVVKRSTVVSL